MLICNFTHLTMTLKMLKHRNFLTDLGCANCMIISLFCLGSKSGFVPKELINRQASMTGGLVGQSEHLILPPVPPVVTMILTLLSVLVRSFDFLVCYVYSS